MPQFSRETRADENSEGRVRDQYSPGSPTSCWIMGSEERFIQDCGRCDPRVGTFDAPSSGLSCYSHLSPLPAEMVRL